MMSLSLDPELASMQTSSAEDSGQGKTIAEVRASTNKFTALDFQSVPLPTPIERTEFTFTSHDGARLSITRATSPQPPSPGLQPAWLYLHGGGLLACSAEIYWGAACAVAVSSGAPVFTVEYRLAPEHRSPCAVEDCFAALTWLRSQASELGIDVARIGVYGESAGGGLAAAVAILGRDRGIQPPIAKQVLIFPMIDDRTTMEPDHPDKKLLMWSPENNVLAWQAYLGEDRAGVPDADVKGYEAPAREPSLEGLPPTYMELGNVELFLHEDLEYAARLSKAGIEVELHVWKGLFHSYEWKANKAAAVQEALAVRKKALRI